MFVVETREDACDPRICIFNLFSLEIPPFRALVLFSGETPVVMVVDNNTPYFVTSVKFSRPKWRKSDHDGGCLKGAPEV
jgi:hypothetical protein